MKRKITLDGRKSRSIVMVLSFFLTALLFSSCEKEDSNEPAAMATENMNNARINPVTESSPGSKALAEKAPKSLVPEEAMVYIYHGSCLGTCPSYTVTLMANGNVLYAGYRNVGTTGTVKFEVEKEVADKIVNEMIQSGFLKLQEFYPSAGSDAAMTVTALRIGEGSDRPKVVVDYGIHVPLILSELRLRIENQLGIDKLVQAGGVPLDMPSHALPGQ